jgi:hypothetical protein
LGRVPGDLDDQFRRSGLDGGLERVGHQLWLSSLGDHAFVIDKPSLILRLP